jgi:hypothetical protein
MTKTINSMIEQEIINLKKEHIKVIKKGHYNYAASLYSRIYELELSLMSKRILSPYT